MSNIIQLSSKVNQSSTISRLSLMEQLQASGLFYTVEQRDNVTFNNSGDIIATGKKTIYNATQDAPIAVMGEGYKIVQNAEVFETFNRAIAKSNIDITGAYIRVKNTDNGSRSMVEYMFPVHSVQPKVGDTVAFSIKVVHSFDGSTAFISSAQGYRPACSNGMVMTNGIITYSQKHSYQLDVENAARIICSGLDQFLINAEEWKKQTTTLVDDTTAYMALAELSGFDNFAIAATYNQYLQVVRPTMKRQPIIEKYMALWNTYKTELGSTQWALNNTLTHISTHGMQQGESSVGYRLLKETKVATVMEKYLKAA